MTREELVQKVLSLGADHAGIVPVDQVPFQPEYRKMCESNTCGRYGKYWSCPPDIGPADELIARAKTYGWALVYQTIGELEDSLDIEGMQRAGERMRDMTYLVREALEPELGPGALYLGTGGCPLCEECTRPSGEPCRFPDKIIPSVSAYALDMSRLAKRAGMSYTNGTNTVTYFGVVFFSEKGDCTKCQP